MSTLEKLPPTRTNHDEETCPACLANAKLEAARNYGTGGVSLFAQLAGLTQEEYIMMEARNWHENIHCYAGNKANAKQARKFPGQ